MRLFTGIALDPNVEARLASVLAELMPAARINWSPVSNLHITLKFIGAWPDERLPELREALGNMRARGPISIQVSQFGYFPNPHRPHSFFAGVRADSGLKELAAEIQSALEPLGLKAEERDYRPHVTLARIKGAADVRGLRERVASMTDFEFGAFEAREFHLYLSQPPSQATERHSVYTKLATYDLMRGTS